MTAVPSTPAAATRATPPTPAPPRSYSWQEKVFGVVVTMVAGLGVTAATYTATKLGTLSEHLAVMSAHYDDHNRRIEALETWGPRSGDRVTRAQHDQLSTEVRELNRDELNRLAALADAMSGMREAVGRIEERLVALDDRVGRIERGRE